MTCSPNPARIATTLALISILLTIGSSHADTFTVTSTADAGADTLRQAILDANDNPGPDMILFDLPGEAPHLIQPVEQFEFLSTGTVLDGTSQPGYVDAPVIFIDGSLLESGDGLRLFGDDIEVRGLAVGNFPANGVVVGAGTGNRVAESYLGTDTTGTVPAPNVISGLILGDSIDTIVDRNLISGNAGSGLLILNFGQDTPGATGTIVRGNIIGADPSGRFAVPNQGGGIFMRRSDLNVFGGPAVGDGNLIAGNTFAGATLDDGANGNVFEGNVFGTDADQAVFLGNSSGIFIQAGSDNIVRGNAFGRHPGSGVIIEAAANDNLIVENLFDRNEINAVRICCDREDDGIFPQRNTVTRNLVFGDPDNTAIELGRFDGNNPRDPLDADAGPNGLQNSPLLVEASLTPRALIISGELRGALSTNYTIEFFTSDACGTFGAGPGEQFLGAIDLTSNGVDGETQFTAEFPIFAPAGSSLTATATADNGDSSEFSPCLELQGVDEEIGYFDSFEGGSFSRAAFEPTLSIPD